jgi:hypothetical protein
MVRDTAVEEMRVDGRTDAERARREAARMVRDNMLSFDLNITLVGCSEMFAMRYSRVQGSRVF